MPSMQYNVELEQKAEKFARELTNGAARRSLNEVISYSSKLRN